MNLNYLDREADNAVEGNRNETETTQDNLQNGNGCAYDSAKPTSPERNQNRSCDTAERAYGKVAFYPVASTTQCGQRFRTWQDCSGSQPSDPNSWCTKEELVAASGDGLHNSIDGRGLRELVTGLFLIDGWYFQDECFLRYLSAVSSSDATCSERELEALSMVIVSRRPSDVETVANRRVWCIFCNPAGSRMTPDVLVIIGLQGNLLNVSVDWGTPSSRS
ncbi:hypothetical protein T265_07926 [Opisthorchis viverrini]|uniref:Uncharacterized protein n=1 Tax=Opisthorchis viverrini TaxID=6198 RepID=A0A074ZBB0_OPIVI|nr:hypothetical protein T265_07926 [Opisthorchis viverrini]KER24413.1 hypothetical protein T265_07926 [Opisthorchis viverrini]